MCVPERVPRDAWLLNPITGRSDGLSIEEVSKALKRIPAARLTFAVGLIFQQTQMFMGQFLIASRLIPSRIAASSLF